MKKTIITILLAVIVVSGRAQTSFDTGDGCLNVIDISYAQGIGEYGATFGKAQTSFDPEEGCLNVVEVSYAKGVGEYGDGGLSANYLHEKFINERFSIGAGIGYSYHKNYKFSAIPIYLSTHYFFLDKRFSPFVNLRIGGFAMFNKDNVGTNEKYSLSKEKQGFSLFMSPSQIKGW